MAMSEACPDAPPEGWWIMTRAFGSARLSPRAPAARRREAMEAAWPMQSVARGDDPAGGIDVEVDGLGGVLGLEEEQLRDDEGGRVVGDGAVYADDALLEQAREDVVGALPAGGVLDHHGHQPILAARGVARRRRVRRGGGEEGPRGGGGEAAQHDDGGGGARV
nr:unnamed protein product [Digitaria exilis]